MPRAPQADAHLVSPRVPPAVNVRELLPFAGATLLAFMLVPIGSHVKWPEYVMALALTLAVIVGTAQTPWQRVPAAARLVPPAVFLGAAALLRDAGGGFDSGVATLALLPVFWVALHGSRAGLGVMVLGVGAFLAVPVLAIGGPAYPATALKTRVLFVVVSGLVGATVQRLVDAVRSQAGEGVRRERELETAAREREVLLARLERLATTDPLTGVGNRRAWDRGRARARRPPRSSRSPWACSISTTSRPSTTSMDTRPGTRSSPRQRVHGWPSFAPPTGSRASAARNSQSCLQDVKRRVQRRTV